MDSSTTTDQEPTGAVPLFTALEDARRRFLALVQDVRPELHRYCARMTGSVADAEDVVQDTLARAYYELSDLQAMPPLRPWLFRIAHNRAIDHWRHEAHRRSEPLDQALELAGDVADQPDSALARRQAVQAALSSFLQLPPAPRGCVILKDVLEHSLEEIAAELEMSLPAVKAALHRGRARLRALAAQPTPLPPASAARAVSPSLQRYAVLFNARDWDALRALLADEVKLDLVARHRIAGQGAVGQYFSNYAKVHDCHAQPAWLDGREVLAVLRDGVLAYFIELRWQGERLLGIRDFRYVPYIAREASIELASNA
ncbi:RNA polymerase sigma factor [Variovorax sp. LARHSF232]